MDGAAMAAPFHPFAVERWLSETEPLARLNFSESGVHPMTHAELVRDAGLDLGALMDLPVDYPQVNGLEALRERIAALYPAAGAANVLVTVGATEANAVAAQTLLPRGAAVVGLRPTYEQFCGNAANLGAEVRWTPLVEEDGWAVDADALDAAMPGATALHVVNPNNPTGAVLSPADRAAVTAAADQHGAWLVVDEVYAGTERAGPPAPTLWGEAERVVAIGSLSKAYGLPGLRLGWVVAPEALVERMWRRHEYAAIAAPMLSMHLAAGALAPDARERITERARRLIRRGFERTRARLTATGAYRVVPPAASAMSFWRYEMQVNSTDLARTLLRDHEVLVVPGDAFGLDGFFRFSSALPEDRLDRGLAALEAIARV